MLAQLCSGVSSKHTYMAKHPVIEVVFHSYSFPCPHNSFTNMSGKNFGSQFLLSLRSVPKKVKVQVRRSNNSPRQKALVISHHTATS